MTCPDREIQNLFSAYMRRGIELQLFKLPTDAPCHVFMCVGVQKKGSGPVISVGLGADFSMIKAVRKACMEFGQMRYSLKQRLMLPGIQKRIAHLVEDPTRVEHLEDHGLLYTGPQWMVAFDFLLKQPISTFQWSINEKSVPEQAAELKNFVMSIGSDFIYYNLTVSDLSSVGIYNCRTIIPQIQPIHFGYKNIRLAGRRLFELPVQLGLKKHPSTLSENKSLSTSFYINVCLETTTLLLGPFTRIAANPQKIFTQLSSEVRRLSTIKNTLAARLLNYRRLH